ncbi:MAG: hypothetical protein GC204_09675 [Chloroflexi bacterium]|nr:hypothetical protein [Chloroflexota bacterium]
MRKFSLILFALMLTVLAVMPAAAESATPEATPEITPEGQVAITLERTACFGTCPVYTVTIYTDGRVVYNGEQFVDVKGEQTSSIDPATVEQLIAGFEAVGYFDWNDSYTDMYITDQPYITTTVRRDGVTKQIDRYAGDESAPLALPYLENWIDLVANTNAWTGADISASSVMSMNAPTITLERTACNGVCPIYQLSIFEDGTVVYTGIDHVAVTGVQTTQIDPSAVELLVREMTASGYFDWNDEYSKFVITDQATVITSISTAEGYKRISRYDGDPNAPVGLVRFEDRIDRVVNTDPWVKGQAE